MNKVLIVGHPQSGYEEVESLLNSCGMASAQPSRRENYLPQQISATLCKAHNAGTVQRIETGADVTQVETSPLWHGLALDLMLGNLEQPFWGWSDPQSIFLLEYWRNLDPAITFVLVYDKPQSVLTQIEAAAAANLSPEALQQRVQGWTSFNAALLHFFMRNPQRCLLVHTQQVRESAASYLQQMRARLDAPWSERMGQLAGPSAITDGAASQEANTAITHSAPSAQACTEPLTLLHPEPDALATFLADALLSQHPTSLQLYDELQACANLPLSDDISHAGPAALDAWRTMINRQIDLQTQAAQLDAVEHAATELKDQLSQAEALAQQKQDLVDQLDAACQQAEQLAQQHQQLLQEQATLLSSTAQDHQKRLTELGAAREALEARQRETSQENELLLNQLHQVQEELERNFLDGQRKTQELASLKAAEAALQMTANEQKERLETGQKQLADQQQLVADLQAQLQARDQETQKRLHALNAELEAARLQARTPPAELIQENELLLNQLHQVQEELERRFLEAQKLRQQLPPPAPAKPVFYGARQRVQQQLGYRLGATMIQHSRSVGGWLSMPFALWGVHRQYKRERPEREAQQLPPIKKYRDAYDADRVRNHLSYRLGQALLTNVRSPIGWVRLPWAIRREVRQFRAQRQQNS